MDISSLLFINWTAAAIYGADLRLQVFIFRIVDFRLKLEGKCTSLYELRYREEMGIEEREVHYLVSR